MPVILITAVYIVCQIILFVWVWRRLGHIKNKFFKASPSSNEASTNKNIEKNYDAQSNYYYQEHSPAELSDWSSRLKLFRYVRAIGGHANDGDSLAAKFEYNNEEDLFSFFKYIGVCLNIHSVAPAQPEKGVSYAHDEFLKFPNIIVNTHWIEQPSHTQINNVPVHIWCHKDEIVICANPGSYEVNEENVCAAEMLEELLLESPLKVINPPKPITNYVWK